MRQRTRPLQTEPDPQASGVFEKAADSMERRFILKDAAAFDDGSGTAVRFHEHPSRYVLRSGHRDYARLATLLHSLVGKEATFLLDWTRPEIVGIRTYLSAV